MSILEIIRKKGVRHVLRSGFEILSVKTSRTLAFYYHTCFRSNKSFVYQGRTHQYFVHPHNTTWANERCVELPITWKVLEGNWNTRVLEVGNVLSHYLPIRHEVVDKYEVGPGVINADIVDFEPTKRYDLIISISTMEHVGWDEDPTNPLVILYDGKKIFRAITNLQNCLNDNGLIFITVPIGFNRQLDNSLNKGDIPFSKRVCLKRVSKHDWIESTWAECKHSEYGFPFAGANALVTLFIEKV